MHVLATAGHVDHGKSALVRALTGMEPDRFEEERRRGMTLDLGFAWTETPAGNEVAFVDVPGHARFVPTMLAGVGPVPAAVLVVAADEGWRQQSAEHLAALHALDVRHGLLAVTRSDLADPGPATAQALEQIAATSLGVVEAVAVSAVTGAGLDELRAAIDRLVGRLPAPDTNGRVRLWVDRAFTVEGAGTVVTGTLPAGSIRRGDLLTLAADGRAVRVRGLHRLGRGADAVTAVSRVAVNLRGLDRDQVSRGDALVAPDAWPVTDEVDVRLAPGARQVPSSTHLVLHVGSAAVPTRLRPLPRTGQHHHVRLRLATALPLTVGDRALLRDPSRHDVLVGVTVLDPEPPQLARRGAPRLRDAALDRSPARPDGADELRRRGLADRSQLARLGATPPADAVVVGGWAATRAWWDERAGALSALVRAHRDRHPLEPGPTVEAARAALGLPDTGLVTHLVEPPLVLEGSRVVRGDARHELPEGVRRPVEEVRARLEREPFTAPDAHTLRDLGLGPRQLAVAERAGLLLRLPGDVVLLPDAPTRAAERLRSLTGPFTVSTARQALGTSRRVAVPLLEHLDRAGVTVPAGDGTRTVAG